VGDELLQVGGEGGFAAGGGTDQEVAEHGGGGHLFWSGDLGDDILPQLDFCHFQQKSYPIEAP
jgi:hypothetical protein